MIAKRYDFTPHNAGDTFEGITLTLTQTASEVTTPIDLTGATIKIVFKKQDQTTVISTLEIGSGITVDDAEGGVISIDSFIVFATPYLYEYDMEITFNPSTIKTYMKGFFKSVGDIS